MSGKWLIGIGAALGLILLGRGAAADIPEYYRVLSVRLPALAESAPPVGTEDPEPGGAEAAAGLVWTWDGIGVDPQPGRAWSGMERRRSLRAFLAPGEFRRFWLAVRLLDEGGTVEVKAGALADGAGNRIAPENILFQRVYYALERKIWDDRNCFPVADGPWQCRLGETFWILTTIHVPENTPAGNYAGVFSLAAGERSVEIPVELAVLARPVPAPEMPFGAFMPGHYHRESEGCYVNYAPEWQTPENLERWVRLWKSRGLNSPFLFHLYADIEMVDGEIRLDIPFLNDLIKLMRQYEMPGPLLLDMRHLSWWSHAVALKLAASGESPDHATPGVRGPDGLSLADTGTREFPAAAKEIFRRTMEAFVSRYGDCGIPLLYLSEEEIGYHQINGFFNTKTVGYETFNPVLADVVGMDRVCLVDNSQGYGYPGIDRGARDGVPFRSYNNWTEEALARARRDGAQVWLYNGGWSRPIAAYLMRLGARAFHQWADGWWDPGYGYWLVTAVNADGALSSLQLERTVEGMNDLGYFKLLDEWQEKALAAGLAEEAESLAQLRRELFGGLPVNAEEFQKSFAGISDDELDRMRWKCVLAVSRVQQAVGETPLWRENRPPPESPEWTGRVRAGRSGGEGSGSEMVALEIASPPVVLDGRCDEAAWDGAVWSGSFRWTANQEARMRAAASSQEEFERMDPPSGSAFRVLYDTAGLYFYCGVNHTGPENSRREDDDPEIWSDDVVEFFWQAPKGAEWHLIVNSRGARTLFRNGTAVPDNAVRTAVSAPLNGSGGVGCEIFIPWTTMECSEKPANDTAWRFNVCRNFNSWNQLSSWAQVDSSFELADGRLLFGGVPASGDLKITGVNAELGVGLNRMELNWPRSGVLQLEIRDAANQPVLQETVPAGEGTVVTLPVGPGAAAGRWRLRLEEDGRERASIPLWFGGASAVTLETAHPEVMRGMPLVLGVVCRAGNRSLEETPLTLELTNRAGGRSHRLELVGATAGRNRIEVATDALEPGTYRLRLRLGEFPGVAETEVSVLPGPY